MKVYYIWFTTLILFSVLAPPLVLAGEVSGVWTKTTSPDPHNITIFYQEENDLKAIGYSEVQGRKIVWYGDGEIKGDKLHCSYRHSSDAIPPGWEQQGVMELSLAADGSVLSGTARSRSGNWSGKIEFKRIQVVAAPVK